MNTNVMFSSSKDDWSTPQDFFDKLDSKYNFTLDPCANDANHKCKKYYTKNDNGLSRNWGGERCFVNPPYGKEIGKWVKKCYEESKRDNTLVVMLIPARTDTRYFHDYIYGKAEIQFIKGRLKFGNGTSPAPFPSMVVIYGKEKQ